MAYETGTASDHDDLWNKLITFLTANSDLVAEGQAWQVAWQAQPGGPNENDIVLMGPGMSGSEEILVGLRREADYIRNSFLFRMVGMTGMRHDATAYNDHVNVSDNVVMYVDKNPMRYWFVANGRRFVVVVKISTVYETMYGGLYLPYADPLAYPYPLMIGGSAGSAYDLTQSWTNTGASHTHFTQPFADGNSPNNRSSLLFLDPSGQWVSVDNGGKEFVKNGASVGPWKWNGGLGVVMSSTYSTAAFKLIQQITECLGGSMLLHPATLVQNSPTNQVWGVMDGVYHVPGNNNASENIVTVNGTDHLVVQNVYRTAADAYWALALE